MALMEPLIAKGIALIAISAEAGIGPVKVSDATYYRGRINPATMAGQQVIAACSA